MRTFLACLFGVLVFAQPAMAAQQPPYVEPTTKDASADTILNVWRNLMVNVWVNDPSHPAPPVKVVKILDVQRQSGPRTEGYAAYAFIRFQPLGSDGTAASWNAAECNNTGEAMTDAGVQLLFGWNADTGAWSIANYFSSLACSTVPKVDQAEIDKPLKEIQVPLAPIPVITMKDVFTPAPGSPERKAIMDTIRLLYPKNMQWVKFKVETLNVGGGFAWLQVMPLKKDGSPVGCAEGDDLLSEYWMKKVEGKWAIVVDGSCAGDPTFYSGQAVRAPPQLIGKNSWKEVVEGD